MSKMLSGTGLLVFGFFAFATLADNSSPGQEDVQVNDKPGWYLVSLRTYHLNKGALPGGFDLTSDDYYVEIHVNGQRALVTSDMEGASRTFDETASFCVRWNPGDAVMVAIREKDIFNPDDELGSGAISQKKFPLTGSFFLCDSIRDGGITGRSLADKNYTFKQQMKRDGHKIFFDMLFLSDTLPGFEGKTLLPEEITERLSGRSSPAMNIAFVGRYWEQNERYKDSAAAFEIAIKKAKDAQAESQLLYEVANVYDILHAYSKVENACRKAYEKRAKKDWIAPLKFAMRTLWSADQPEKAKEFANMIIRVSKELGIRTEINSMFDGELGDYLETSQQETE